PLGRGGVVHLIGGEDQRRPEESEVWILGSGHSCGATDQIDLATSFGGERRTAVARQWRDRLPGIRYRIVLPSVVNGLPRTAERDLGVFRDYKPAEHVNLAVRSGQRGMVGRPRHRLFLGPLISSWVVLVVGAPRLAIVPAADHVHLAVHGN